MRCYYQWPLIIFLFIATWAQAAVGSDLPSQDVAKQQAQFTQWHQAGLRWFTVGDNLVLIFPSPDFYVKRRGKLILRQQTILQQVADWLQPIPKTWVHLSGFRQQAGNLAQVKRLADNDARALARYFWDKNIDARGVYTSGIVERLMSPLSSTRSKRVEMVVHLLPMGHSLR